MHFPRFAELKGKFLYRATPVFMNSADELSYGEPQEAAIELASAAPQKGRRKAVVERRLYEQAPRAGSRAVFVGAPISAPDCDAAERDCRDLGLDGGDVRR